jgi:hypothetical protein
MLPGAITAPELNQRPQPQPGPIDLTRESRA